MFFNTIVNQRFIKMFKENAKKSPYIFGLYVIKSYLCTRFQERRSGATSRSPASRLSAEWGSGLGAFLLEDNAEVSGKVRSSSKFFSKNFGGLKKKL